MNILAGLAGSATGIVVMIAVVILLAHLAGDLGAHLFDRAHPWAYRFLIILMYGAGALVAYSGVGGWWSALVSYAAGFAGGMGAPVPGAVVTLASFFLILALVVSLLFTPTPAAVMAAALIPAVLMFTSRGFVHGFWVDTSGPAQQFATAFRTWLGG